MKVLESNPDLFYSTIMGKRVVCFGAGKMPVDAIKALKIRDLVEYFYDNAESKWNTMVGVQGKRYLVHNPAEIDTLQDVQDIVILITNRDYYREILQQLNTYESIRKIEVFLYPEFDLGEFYAFQKTEKYLLMLKYWKCIELNQHKKRLDIGLQLLNYVFEKNMYYAKKIADLAMQENQKRTALHIYVKLFEDGYETDYIFNWIQRNYPVYTEIDKDLFDYNFSILEKYPYIYGGTEENITDEWIYFREGNSIFPYNKDTRKFGREIIVDEPQNAFCRIEDNGKPVFLENVFNEYVLIYLSYIIRDSKAYGTDNHVYLYYDNAMEFYHLLRFIDLSFLKERPKFVFLLGEENRKKYPLEQLSQENVSEPKMLDLNEMQHICILISNGDCGSGFFTGVMTSNKYVVGNEDKEFYYYSKLPKQFSDILKNTKRRYTYQEILQIFEDNIDNIVMPMDDKPFRNYVDFFKENYFEKDTFNVTDIWKIYFIAKFYLDGGPKDTRFVPCIFWDIHNGKRQDFFNMIKEFSLVDYFAPVRDPIIKLVRAYDRGLFGITCENHFADLRGRILNGFDQKYSYPDAFDHKYVVAKFEECKLYPQEMFSKICYTLCIPYSDLMLEAEARESGNIEGECIKGFDLLPVNRKIDHVFSDFDKVRLEMLYSQICEHYGYDYYDFDEQPITDEEIELLFSKPFRVENQLFDRCYTRVEEDTEWKRKFDFENTAVDAKLWFDSKEEVRETMLKLMMEGYKISRYENIKFPFFIRKSIQDSVFEEFM